MKNNLVKLLATGFYSGLFPWVPGTIGTIPAWLIAYYIIGDRPVILIPVMVVTFILSVWSAGEAEELYGHDARKIVIDEWAGMFIALILVPYSMTNYLIAFVAFRFFDVVKIYPARRWEKLKGGWGVTMDDIAAGLQANIITQLIVIILMKINTTG